jgi:hypothetical protein
MKKADLSKDVELIEEKAKVVKTVGIWRRRVSLIMFLFGSTLMGLFFGYLVYSVFFLFNVSGLLFLALNLNDSAVIVFRVMNVLGFLFLMGIVGAILWSCSFWLKRRG